jgi:D-glycero-D-manno-heptose 1,7-bisphosphate phosphatase
MKHLALLDRDGTIIAEKKFLADPAGVRLIPGAARAIRKLNDAGWAVAIVTNQSGVGRGYYTLDAMHATNARVVELLARKGARVDAVEYCPHHPQAEVARYRRRCRCRKPGTGQALKAARRLGATLTGCGVIGDRLVDVEMGLRLGGSGVLVLTGLGREHRRLAAEEGVKPTAVVRDLPAAVRWILRNESKRRPKEFG